MMDQPQGGLGFGFWAMLVLAFAGPFIYVGCADVGPKPTRVDTHTVTNTAQLPVSTPCIAPADLPPYPERTAVDPKTATTDQLAAAAANDAEVFLAYSKAVKTLLAQCTKGAR